MHGIQTYKIIQNIKWLCSCIFLILYIVEICGRKLYRLSLIKWWHVHYTWHSVFLIYNQSVEEEESSLSPNANNEVTLYYRLCESEPSSSTVHMWMYNTKYVRSKYFLTHAWYHIKERIVSFVDRVVALCILQWFGIISSCGSVHILEEGF